MVKRTARTTPRRVGAPVAPAEAEARALVRSTLYLPGAVHEALREVAYQERCKIHDVIMSGIDVELRRRGYPGVEALKSGRRK